MEIKQVLPSHRDSYEYVCHEVKSDNFLLPLREPLKKITREKLLQEQLERAIGVIYRPETEYRAIIFMPPYLTNLMNISGLMKRGQLKH